MYFLEQDIFEPDYRYTKSFIDTWSVDEIIILDISRKYNNEIKKFINLVRKFSENSFVPLTIGGKIKTLKDVSDIMNSGADKVSINTKALQDPSFIGEVSSRYGSQAVVISIDVKKKAKNMRYLVIMGVSQLVFHHSNGQKNVKKMGAGEILVTSIDRDGFLNGFDLELCKRIKNSVKLPV